MPAAGVSLYQNAQALEQLSRTEKDRKKNAPQIRSITGQLADARFVNGFGSMGGEEFFSYLNISDSLHRTGGAGVEQLEQPHQEPARAAAKRGRHVGRPSLHHGPGRGDQRRYHDAASRERSGQAN